MAVNPQTYPVGVSQTAHNETPAGPEIFDSFKDSQGRYRTQSLFIETAHESYPAFFTLKRVDVEKDGIQYVSLYQKYMEIGDPTEYKVALRLFGSWDHWQALCRSKWFKEHLDGWRAELKVRMESDRYFEMRDRANDQGATGIQASKWLADRYGDKDIVKRGRPTNAEKNAHLKRIAQQTSELDEDAERLGLKQV